MGPDAARRTALVMIAAAVAYLTAGRLGLAAPTADTPPALKPAPRGWREARHWRKI